MVRKVLIIGSPLFGRDFLVGVKEDVRHFYRFVRSSNGGAYAKHEITYMQHPTNEALESYLQSIGEADIFTVFFSGHGFRTNGKDHICINAQEQFRVESFLRKAKRYLIFIDACRTPLDMREKGDAISGIGYQFSNEHLLYARQLHCNYIKNAPLGGAIVFSTTENEPSQDTEIGGAFTMSLMSVLHNWPHIIDTRHEKVMSVGRAFQRASTVCLQHHPGQQPAIYHYKSKEAFNIPFAINPEAHLAKLKSLHYYAKS